MDNFSSFSCVYCNEKASGIIGTKYLCQLCYIKNRKGRKKKVYLYKLKGGTKE